MKIRKTYRLSELAINTIESRDKEKYPTATDFLEHKILVPDDKSDISNILHIVQRGIKEARDVSENNILMKEKYKKLYSNIESEITTIEALVTIINSDNKRATNALLNSCGRLRNIIENN